MSDDLTTLLRGAAYLAFEDGTNDYTTAPKAAKTLEAQAARIAKLEAALGHAREADRADLSEFLHKRDVDALQKRVAELEGALRNARVRYIELSDKDAAEAMAEIINEALGDVK